MGSVSGSCRVIALVFGVALACGYEVHNDHSSDGCPAGSAGCPCAEDDGCDGVLECVGGVCQTGGGATSTTSLATSSSFDTSSTMTTTTTTGFESTASTTASSGTCSPPAPEDTDCSFLCDLDLGGPAQECDKFAQDCPCGQKCAAYDSNGNDAYDSLRCVDVIGSGQLGDPCVANPLMEGGDDCAKGLMCWYPGDETPVCIALCTGTVDNSMCEPGSSCFLVADGVLNPCLPHCDPLLQDCLGGHICAPTQGNEGFWCFPEIPDAGSDGAACEFAYACAPGLMCVNADFYPDPACQDSLGCCAPFCDLAHGDDDCQDVSVDGVVCVPYSDPEPAPAGLEHVGVCGVMP